MSINIKFLNKNLLLFSLVLSIPTILNAQNWIEGKGIEINYFHSNMMRHSKKITAPLAENTSTFELSLTQKAKGDKDWQIRRNYPETGVGLFYVDYNRPDIYGQAIGIVPHIRLRLITLEHFAWSVRMGMGICYYTTPYQKVPNNNIENETIGSYLNNLTPMETDLRYIINQHLTFQAGIHLIHLSNGSYRRPNFGINIWGIQAGIQYFPIPNNPKRIVRPLPELKNRILLYPKVAISFIEQGQSDGGLNRVYNVGAYATKRYLGKNKIILGTDYTYNTATYSYLKYNDLKEGQENKYASQISIYAGNEFEFNRIGIVLQGGVYLRRMFEQHDTWYEKLGVNFYCYKKETGFLKEGLVSIMLKAHKNRAELFEIGFAVGF
ncbi:MAG TPA: acyloxyacyl hydrolase [Edaphocola sp.]|nr:acyloxyacyl hydrolase [Edaphocola sp.]